MAKRRISKASKRRLTFFGTISLIAIIYFCISLIFNIYTIYTLTKNKKSLENLYIELQEDAENLKIDIEKLNDDEYLANYAREHYFYSKDGEYILQIDDVNDIEEAKNNISEDINNNYLIVFLSILMVFVFIYIISKSRRRKK